jgi:hypothetical protein
VRYLDLSRRVLVHRERVDHPDRVARPEPLQLGDDLAVELRVVESQHDELDWSDRHCRPSLRCRRPIPRAVEPKFSITSRSRPRLTPSG